MKYLPVGVVCRGQYGILDFSEESRMRFEKFRNVHEDQLLVGILDTDQATEEILFEHVQNFNVIALCINLVETLYKVISLSLMLWSKPYAVRVNPMTNTLAYILPELSLMFLRQRTYHPASLTSTKLS